MRGRGDYLASGLLIITLIVQVLLFMFVPALWWIPTFVYGGLLVYFLARMTGLLPNRLDRTGTVVPLTTPSPTPTAEDYYQYMADRYGAGYRELRVDCKIAPDGSASIERTVKFEAFTELEELETYLLIAAPPPEDSQLRPEPVKIESLSRNRSVTPTYSFRQERKITAKLHFKPALRRGEVADFRIIESIPSSQFAIGRTAEDLRGRREPFDYFGWNINRPTHDLLMRVSFPEGELPEVRWVEVAFASTAGLSSGIEQSEERRRTGELEELEPEFGQHVLRLRVPFPMIGLVYIIKWEPKPKQEDGAEEPPAQPEAQSLSDDLPSEQVSLSEHHSRGESESD